MVYSKLRRIACRHGDKRITNDIEHYDILRADTEYDDELCKLDMQFYNSSSLRNSKHTGKPYWKSGIDM